MFLSSFFYWFYKFVGVIYKFMNSLVELRPSGGGGGRCHQNTSGFVLAVDLLMSW